MKKVDITQEVCPEPNISLNARDNSTSMIVYPDGLASVLEGIMLLHMGLGNCIEFAIKRLNLVTMKLSYYNVRQVVMRPYLISLQLSALVRVYTFSYNYLGIVPMKL